MDTTTRGSAERSTTSEDEAIAVCVRAMHLMGTGSLADLRTVIHPDATNREGKDEPAACRGRGAEAFYATALWLRAAYSDLHWEIHDAVHAGDLVVLHTSMAGRQTGPFVTYDERAAVQQAMPPNGKPFSVTQSHWFRVADGKVVEHWANRDDLGLAEQLGWIPPTPKYLARMALAKRWAAFATG